MPAMWRLALLSLVSGVLAQDDRVQSLPSYGPPKTRHYSGFRDATPDGNNKLFYYFVEADVGSNNPDTPFLIWLNGGPGASSLIGLLLENLGPQAITENGTLADNPHHITKEYHLMVVDNPVGAGYSHTTTGAYVTSEEEMRTQFVYALKGFYELHPEYKRNPLWVTGESYAGKYIPNVAYEIATVAPELPLQGMIIGNGLYNEPVQYMSVGDLAFGEGVIDENLLAQEKVREAQCLAQIAAKNPKAGDFCENVTVRWLYTGPEAAAGELFYYDFGITDASFFDVTSARMGTYLNSAEVKTALHVGDDITWQNADETGPVAEALFPDFTIPSYPVVEQVLALGKQVVMYNGVRDGSVCNHVGNLRALLALSWPGAAEFQTAQNLPWPSRDNVMGHIRGARNLRFATVMRTGHLVPNVVPEAFAVLIGMIVKGKPEQAADVLVV